MSSKKRSSKTNTNSPRDDLTEEYLLSSISLLVMNCIINNKNFQIQSNDVHRPWNNIAADIEGSLLFIAVSHVKKFNCNNFFSVYLEERGKILERLDASINSPLFVYYKTSKDRSFIHQRFTKVKEFPNILDLILTDRGEVWQETVKDCEGNIVRYGNTFVCMNQYGCYDQRECITQLLTEYLQLNLSSAEINDKWLYDIENEFLNFVRNWYHTKAEALTSEDVRCAISDFILKKYKINVTKFTTLNKQKVDTQGFYLSEELKRLIGDHSLIVINHRFFSAFTSNIWNYLVHGIENLSETELSDLWREGKIHMPFQSEDSDSDKLILLALRIRKVKVKVVIFRYRRFSIEENGDIMVSLLHNLPESGNLSVPEKENFGYSVVDYDFLKQPHLKLHKDSFCKILQENYLGYLSETTVVEALDQSSFVNEFHHHGGEEYAIPAIHLCLRIKQIDLSTIDQLLQMGAKTDIAIHGGITPLLAAIESSREDIVEFLLEKGANTELANCDSDTPLHVACKTGKVKMVKLLLKYGADTDALDRNRKKPFEVCDSSKFEEQLRVFHK